MNWRRVPPHKFYHGHSTSQKQSLEWPEKHFGERFAHLSRKRELSFTVNCKSGPCYVFGTFKLVSMATNERFLIDTGGKTGTQSPTLRHPPTIQKIHFPLPTRSPIIIHIQTM